jgi:CubicO group peptidase (beta-lactamase class C family)
VKIKSSMDGSTGCGQRNNPRDTRRAPLASAMLMACLLAGGTASAQHVDRPVVQKPQAALEHGLRPVVLKAGEPLPRWSLQERMAHYHVPGVAIAILKDGEVVHAMGYGIREAGTHDAVDADTLFSVGSISKVATAATSLRLLSQGRIDLDRDVSTYLKSWRIPSAPDIGNPVVTMRMLMSHTAGLNVHGFQDYQPGESLPTLIQTLDGKSPAKNDAVRLQREPGWVSDYSGGGVMVEQQVIEDVTGLPLEAVARTLLFEPIGMPRSTFENPLPAARGNIAKAHDEEGRPTALPRGWETFPEQGASGLWTSANELGAFVGALIKSYQGNGNFLPRAIATEMMTEVSPSPHGLGPRVEGAGTTRIFHHGGANDSYHSWIEGYLETGDGFVILTNGARGYDLHREIRNALSDALGHGVNPPVLSVALQPGASGYTDYAGSYRIDAAVPMDVRRALADSFDYDSFDVKVADGAVQISLPGASAPLSLLPVSPTQFINPSGSRQFEVHRDAHGVVRAWSVTQGASHAYYRRQPPGPAAAAAGK